MLIIMSFDWGWLFMFACFVYSMFLHVPSSCQGLLLSSYLPCFAKPLHITVCCNVCFKFVQVLWLSSWSSIAPSICVSLPRLPAGRGSHYLLPPIFWCIYSRTLADVKDAQSRLCLVTLLLFIRQRQLKELTMIDQTWFLLAFILGLKNIKS